MKKKLGIIAASILLVLLGSVAVVQAMPESFWSQLAKTAGITLGQLLAGKVSAPSQAAEKPVAQSGKFFGATYANPSIAEVSMTESVTSTCSLLNNDGSDRIMTRIDVFFNPDDTATSSGYSTGTALAAASGPNTWDMSTSSNQYSTSTGSAYTQTSIPIFSRIPFVSSTRPMFFSSSTFSLDNSTTTALSTMLSSASSTQVHARRWKNGEYLNLVFSQPTSSTGFCAVTYFNK